MKKSLFFLLFFIIFLILSPFTISVKAEYETEEITVNYNNTLRAETQEFETKINGHFDGLYHFSYETTIPEYITVNGGTLTLIELYQTHKKVLKFVTTSSQTFQFETQRYGGLINVGFLEFNKTAFYIWHYLETSSTYTTSNYVSVIFRNLVGTLIFRFRIYDGKVQLESEYGVFINTIVQPTFQKWTLFCLEYSCEEGLGGAINIYAYNQEDGWKDLGVVEYLRSYVNVETFIVETNNHGTFTSYWDSFDVWLSPNYYSDWLIIYDGLGLVYDRFYYSRPTQLVSLKGYFIVAKETIDLNINHYLSSIFYVNYTIKTIDYKLNTFSHFGSFFLLKEFQVFNYTSNMFNSLSTTVTTVYKPLGFYNSSSDIVTFRVFAIYTNLSQQYSQELTYDFNIRLSLDVFYNRPSDLTMMLNVITQLLSYTSIVLIVPSVISKKFGKKGFLVSFLLMNIVTVLCNLIPLWVLIPLLLFIIGIYYYSERGEN